MLMEKMSFQLFLEYCQGFASWMGLERSFHKQGAMKEKVLERDFVPLCDGTTRRRSFTDRRISDGMKTHKRK